MLIAGVTIENSQVKSFDTLSPKKEQYRQVSISGVNREALTISYTYRYNLKLQSLSTDKYRELFQALLTADKTDNGQITIDNIGEVRAGVIHVLEPMPNTITFDFDITTISPEPKAAHFNMIIPLSVYEAV